MITKEKFVEALVDVYVENGVNISRDKLWKLFKATVHSIVDQVIDDEDSRIALSGIGVFEMIRANPRCSKVGVVDYVPRLRYRPSTSINTIMEIKTDQVPDPDKMAKVRAQLEKDGKLVCNLPPRKAKEESEEATDTKKAPKQAAKKASKQAAKKPSKQAAKDLQKQKESAATVAATAAAPAPDDSDDFDDEF